MWAVHKYRAGVMLSEDRRLVVTTETHAVASPAPELIRRRIPWTQRLIGILTCGNTINIFASSGVPTICPGPGLSISASVSLLHK